MFISQVRCRRLGRNRRLLVPSARAAQLVVKPEGALLDRWQCRRARLTTGGVMLVAAETAFSRPHLPPKITGRLGTRIAITAKTQAFVETGARPATAKDSGPEIYSTQTR